MGLKDTYIHTYNVRYDLICVISTVKCITSQPVHGVLLIWMNPCASLSQLPNHLWHHYLGHPLVRWTNWLQGSPTTHSLESLWRCDARVVIMGNDCCWLCDSDDDV